MAWDEELERLRHKQANLRSEVRYQKQRLERARLSIQRALDELDAGEIAQAQRRLTTLLEYVRTDWQERPRGRR